MKNRFFLLGLVLVLGSCCARTFAQDQVEVINDEPLILQEGAEGINLEKAKLNSPEAAALLIGKTIGMKADKDFYCIIHVLRWKGTDSLKPDAPTLETQNWYLYSNGKLSDHTAAEGLRIYGSHKVSVLYLHLNVPAAKIDAYKRVAYRVEVTKKLPAPLQNLNLLFGLIAGAQSLLEDKKVILWGGRHLAIEHLPSDITVRAILGNKDNQGQEKQTEMSKQTYDNEGRYRWDISAGLPLKSINELEYVATDGTIRHKKIERQNVYAFLNLYPVPVDTKEYKAKESFKNFFKKPSFIVGLPIKGKPLERPIVGGGFLLYRAQVFAGVAFNRVREPQTMKAGEASTQAKLEADLKFRTEPKFVWGINVPMRQIVDALKAKK